MCIRDRGLKNSDYIYVSFFRTFQKLQNLNVYFAIGLIFTVCNNFNCLFLVLYFDCIVLLFLAIRLHGEIKITKILPVTGPWRLHR